MPKSRFVLLIAWLAVVVLAPAAIAGGVGGRSARDASARAARACGPTSILPRRSNVRRIAHITLCLINRQRAAHGLHPLHGNGALGRAARGHSSDMVRRHYFSHYTPQGVGPFQRMLGTGYAAHHRVCAIGENIAAATGRFASPGSIVKIWMNSPGHRANILSAGFHDTGIGVAYGYPGASGYRGATYTEDFGSRC